MLECDPLSNTIASRSHHVPSHLLSPLLQRAWEKSSSTCAVPVESTLAMLSMLTVTPCLDMASTRAAARLMDSWMERPRAGF